MDTHQINQDTPQPGAQPAAEVLAPTGGEQLPFDAQQAIATLDPAVLMELLENDANPTKPTVVNQAPPAGEQPHGEEDGIRSDDGATKPRARLSVRALPENQQAQLAAAIDLVRKGEHPNIASAILSLSGVVAGEVATSNVQAIDLPQPAPPAATPAPEVAEVQERLATLREQRKAAKLNYNVEEEIQLTEDIEAASIELFRAEQSAATRQVATRNYQSDFSAAVESVETKYPDSLDESTAFSRILDDKVAAARSRNDPALADPNYIIGFADEVAAMLGQAQAPAAMPRPPARASRPVGSSLAPGHGASPRLTLQDARNLVQTASIEDLKAALYTH